MALEDAAAAKKLNKLYCILTPIFVLLLFQVMRMIQDKLNTPTNSMEALDSIPSKSIETKEKPVQKIQVEEKPVAVVNKATPYRPPSINLSTWSERPKTQVSLQDDTDYRTNNSTNTNSSKVTINTGTSIPQNGYARNYDGNSMRTHDSNVSIKVNGSEPIVSQKSGNVIIKIGTNETFFRRPLGNLHPNETKSRPHSIAIDSTLDVSRVPIVRSVELKKPFKDVNKSVTQINSNNDRDTNETDSYYKQSYKNFCDSRDVPDKFAEHRRNSETLNVSNGFRPNGKHSSFYVNDQTKPVVRVNSSTANNAIPTVRGFRTADTNGNVHRKTWHTSSNVLPSKIYEESTTTNRNVPFSQSTLKRTDSSLNSTNNNSTMPFANVVLRNTSQSVINNNYRNSIGSFPPMEKQTPQPPKMPEIMSFAKKPQKEFDPKADPRDELLSAIRNFGGKKGLKAVKV